MRPAKAAPRPQRPPRRDILKCSTCDPYKWVRARAIYAGRALVVRERIGRRHGIGRVVVAVLVVVVVSGMVVAGVGIGVGRRTTGEHRLIFSSSDMTAPS